MYGALKSLALRVLKTPSEPPEPPAGSHESLQVFRASPRYLSYRLLVFWLLCGALWSAWWVLVVAGLVGGEPAPLVLAAILFPILAVLQFCAYFLVRVDFELRYYVVTDRSLRVREGALIVKEMTLTYANVQNLKVVQGPLMKLFGLWNLRVDTAGGGAGEERHRGSGHSVVLAGIENAHAVRDLVLGHLKKHGAGTGLGDLDDADHRHGFAASAELLGLLRELRDSAAGLHRACGSSVE